MPTPILSRVPPESRQKLLTTLGSGQSAALKTMLTAGLLRPVLPDEIAQPLIAAGYVKVTLGGTALTDVGVARAMMENGHS